MACKPKNDKGVKPVRKAFFGLDIKTDAILRAMKDYFKPEDLVTGWEESEPCPNCGYLVTEYDNFCYHCGADLQAADAAEDKAEVEVVKSALITKSLNEELKQGTFVVLAPNQVDLHGDIYSEEDVRKACHNFNAFCEKAYLDHAVETEEMTFAESYIAPADMELGGVQITKGTWLAVCQFSDNLWPQVKSGEYTGLSIGAYAKVEDVE